MLEQTVSLVKVGLLCHWLKQASWETGRDGEGVAYLSSVLVEVRLGRRWGSDREEQSPCLLGSSQYEDCGRDLTSVLG